nr:hypothetical protein [Tanacetum cinerariifolium]
MPGGIGSSGVKDKSISSIRESLSSTRTGDGENDSIAASEFSETNSFGGRGDAAFPKIKTSIQSLNPRIAYQGGTRLMTRASVIGVCKNKHQTPLKPLVSVTDFRVEAKDKNREVDLEGWFRRNAHIKRKAKRRLKWLDQEVAAYPNGYEPLAYDNVSGFFDE